MKSLLLGLTLAGSLLQAQDVPNVDSVFGRGEGVNGTVYAIAMQTDGKILIGGEFSAVNGVPRQNLARLNADGSLDPEFVNQFTFGANGPVYAIAVQADGNIIVGGNFSTVGNAQRTDIARLDATGAADPKFGGPGEDFGTNGTVQAISIQADGKIIIGGSFNVVAGQQCRNLARLSAEGKPDTAFVSPSLINGTVRAIAISADGLVVAGGAFSTATSPARSILRLP